MLYWVQIPRVKGVSLGFSEQLLCVSVYELGTRVSYFDDLYAMSSFRANILTI